jgi:hypothetical protein
MRLEMASFPVRLAELGARTTYAHGLLTIDAGPTLFESAAGS